MRSHSSGRARRPWVQSVDEHSLAGTAGQEQRSDDSQCDLYLTWRGRAVTGIGALPRVCSRAGYAATFWHTDVTWKVNGAIAQA